MHKKARTKSAPKKANGRSFGMSSHGRFILKLTDERSAALVAEGIGKLFSPGAGRVMKSWVDVTNAIVRPLRSGAA